jgi:methylated-DNA-[protein]-cysteine S-methyltransferase
MTSTPVLSHATPIGPLTLAASEHGLIRCGFRPATESRTVTTSTSATTSGSPAAWAWLDLARRELDAYFTGELRRFGVPADLRRVSSPQRHILDALAEVRYGATTTYGALAAKLGLTEDGPRQVGAAMARNPVAIVVPCHRVIGADGRLVGYAGGLAAKQSLLDLESHDREYI